MKEKIQNKIAEAEKLAKMITIIKRVVIGILGIIIIVSAIYTMTQQIIVGLIVLVVGAIYIGIFWLFLTLSELQLHCLANITDSVARLEYKLTGQNQ